MNSVQSKPHKVDNMKSHFNDIKADKSKELNESMTIKPTSQDSYTSKIHNMK